jgi:hypothetical protein
MITVELNVVGALLAIGFFSLCIQYGLIIGGLIGILIDGGLKLLKEVDLKVFAFHLIPFIGLVNMIKEVLK